MLEETITRHIQWIRDHTSDNSALVVPISGGSDSGLCLWLCAQARPGLVTGIYHGSEELRAKEWFESAAKIVYDTSDPGTIKDLEVFRWALFLEHSLANDSVLIGSRTKTEHFLGTFSLASRVASVLPILDLWKGEIMRLCRHIGMPQEIILSSQEADPPCGRPAELAVIPFEEVDKFLKSKVQSAFVYKPTIAKAQLDYLNHLYKKNRFKSQLPFVAGKH